METIQDLMTSIGLKTSSDLENDVTKRMTSILIKKRETQILDVLKKNGFVFENKDQLIDFMKTRCERYIQGNVTKLLIDEKVICEWNDSVNIEFDGNTVKATMGI